MIKHDLTGMTFGRLTVIKSVEERSRRGYVQWLCQCSCGNKTVIILPSEKLTSGHTRSCGCISSELIRARNISRANYPVEDRETRLYRIWKGILARTTYPSQLGYENYGGRGIMVCSEWRKDFIAFRDWALTHGYSDELTIERMDTNGDYTPFNCRWATRKEQNNNQRSNIVLTVDNESHTVAQWAELMGITKDSIYKRIRRGRPIETVLKEFFERR